ncbi:MAG: hypothetical protein IPI58_00430 [Alphaproteobacteria bacterium]|nr:MAG: hypothetical protein IPI58_00430 [Alphaproteobacteria bacterium]
MPPPEIALRLVIGGLLWLRAGLVLPVSKKRKAVPEASTHPSDKIYSIKSTLFLGRDRYFLPTFIETYDILLNGPRNRLLAEEVQQRVTVNPTPSRADLEQTREIDKALKSVSIDLLDHVIIGRGGRVFSMKNESAW